ncbi:unnamed protein product [Gordionus sp. m RMFG-2023]
MRKQSLIYSYFNKSHPTPNTTLENLPDGDDNVRVQSPPSYLPIANLKDQTIPLLDQVQSLTYLPISKFQDQTIQLIKFNHQHIFPSQIFKIRLFIFLIKV